MVAIVGTVTIANLGNSIISPAMAAIKDEFGASAGEVGLIASGFGLGRLAMDLPAGYLTDRLSAARLFLLGIVVLGGTAILAALSTSLQQLILARTAMGFGSAIMSTVALTLLDGHGFGAASVLGALVVLLGAGAILALVPHQRIPLQPQVRMERRGH